MTTKDLTEMQTVCSVYSMCYCLNDLLDSVACDLPEGLCTASFIECLNKFISDMGEYNESKRDMFINACEDSGSETD